MRKGEERRLRKGAETGEKRKRQKYIPTSLPQEQAAKLNGKDPAKGVFNIMHT